MLLRTIPPLAEKLLQKGGVCVPPVPEELVQQADNDRPVEVRRLFLKAHHGALWQLKDKWIIQLNCNDTLTQQRFTLFHEVFHIIANNRSISWSKEHASKRCFFNERLADSFANCVLLPEEWIRQKWATINNLDAMAKLFGVSKSVMYARLKRLGLIDAVSASI